MATIRKTHRRKMRLGRISYQKKLTCFYKRYGIVFTFRALLHYFCVRTIHAVQQAFGIGQSNKIQNPQKRSVLFVTFSYASESKRYRVDHLREYLSNAHIENDVVFIEDLERFWLYALSFKIVVISHLPLDARLQRFIDEAKKKSIKFVYSMDDPLFLSDVMHKYFRLPEEFGEQEKEFYYAEADARLALLKQCNCFIASTEYLANQVRELSIPAYVIRNGFSREMITLAERALDSHSGGNDKRTVIGYFSGTRTHNYDFTFATEALLRILKECPHVVLRIYGYLDIDERFKKFKKQIQRHPLVHWKKLPFEIAKVDIRQSLESNATVY